MNLFLSRRERKFWILSLIVTLAIYLSAVISQPIVGFLSEKGILEVTFFIGFILILITIFLFQFRKRIGLQELGVWIGISAVYLMLLVRIQIPAERTHIIEFSILALFIYEALSERMQSRQLPIKPVMFAIVLTSSLGIIDECIQIYVPDRVFDMRDILFNTLAAVMSTFSCLVLEWVKGKYNNS